MVTDNDHALRKNSPMSFSDLVWSLRDDFQVEDAVPIDDAVRMSRCGEGGFHAQATSDYGFEVASATATSIL